jgi:AraC-like DNA-binding protein
VTWWASPDPTTHRGDRDLVGRGWAAAALLRPAAVPAFTEDPGSLRDAYRTLALPELHRLVGAAMELDPVGVERPGAPATRPGADPIDAGGQRRARAVEAIAGWLAARIPTLTDEARLANAMADVIDGESEVLRLEDVADRLHVTPRTLQRLAVRYVGVPPAAMIRRRRLQEAAERVRVDPQADLAVIAASLGYTDQSHLTRDFHAVLGFTPGAYRSTTRESR